MEAGAKIETVQVKIEVDPQQQKVRAIATGSTELRAKEMKSDPKTDEEILAIVAENLGVAKEELKIAADNGHMVAVCYESVRKKFLIFRGKDPDYPSGRPGGCYPVTKAERGSLPV